MKASQEEFELLKLPARVEWSCIVEKAIFKVHKILGSCVRQEKIEPIEYGKAVQKFRKRCRVIFRLSFPPF